MKQQLIDYKGKRKKPRIRMLTSAARWSKGVEYNVQYETINDKGGELYINDEYDGTTYIEKTLEGVEFEYVRKLI